MVSYFGFWSFDTECKSEMSDLSKVIKSRNQAIKKYYLSHPLCDHYDWPLPIPHSRPQDHAFPGDMYLFKRHLVPVESLTVYAI